MFCWKILSTNDEGLIVLEFLGNFNESDYRESPQKADHGTRRVKSIQDCADRKVKTASSEGKLRNNVYLSHLYCRREPGKGQHEDLVLLPPEHYHKSGEM